MSTFTVTNLNDSGSGSLRAALTLANGQAGADTIVFQPGLIGTLTLTSGQLTISDSVTIEGDSNGDGIPDITVNGNAHFRVFDLTAGTSTLDGLVITNGRIASSYANGGA